jgi:hypothetical protein
MKTKNLVSAKELGLLQEIVETTLERLEANNNVHLGDGGLFIATVDLCPDSSTGSKYYHCTFTLFDSDLLYVFGPALGPMGFKRVKDSSFGPVFSFGFSEDDLEALLYPTLFKILVLAMEEIATSVEDLSLESMSEKREAMNWEKFYFLEPETEEAI